MTLTVTDGTGITSCLSVRLSDACGYYRTHDQWPTAIDSSKQFWWYKDGMDIDLTPYFLQDYSQPLSEWESAFHHNWQYNWYDTLFTDDLFKIVRQTCWPADHIQDRAAEISDLIGNRVAVLYRGNDKAKEIRPTPYDDMVQMAQDTGEDAFFVQTDDDNFYRHFIQHYPNTVTLPTLPRIASDPDSYVMPTRNKASFAAEFLSVIFALSFSRKLLITTGNTGLWAVLYRGNCEGVWQHHGNQERWRRLS